MLLNWFRFVSDAGFYWALIEVVMPFAGPGFNILCTLNMYDNIGYIRVSETE